MSRAEVFVTPIGVSAKREQFRCFSTASQAAGREYIERLESRKDDRDLPPSRDSALAQLAAIREWGAIPAKGRYEALKNIAHSTLIVHGNKDIVVAPINALILAEHLPNAQLIVYPDSSHGAQYQHATMFLAHAKLFLKSGGPMLGGVFPGERDVLWSTDAGIASPVGGPTKG